MCGGSSRSRGGFGVESAQGEVECIEVRVSAEWWP